MTLDNIMMNKKEAILIIGATGGIGKILSEELKKNNYYLIGNGRREDILKEMKDKKILDDYIVGDLTNEDDRKKIIEKIKEFQKEYKVILFYNLGILYKYPRNFGKYTKDQISKSYDTNLKSIVHMDNELIMENIILDTIYMGSISSFYTGGWDKLYQQTKDALKGHVETIIFDDKENNRERKIRILFPDTIKTGDEGMGSELKEFPKIPIEYLVKEIVKIIDGTYKYKGYIFEIEDNKINLYGIDPDKRTNKFEYYGNKYFIKDLGNPVY